MIELVPTSLRLHLSRHDRLPSSFSIQHRFPEWSHITGVFYNFFQLGRGNFYFYYWILTNALTVSCSFHVINCNHCFLLLSSMKYACFYHKKYIKLLLARHRCITFIIKFLLFFLSVYFYFHNLLVVKAQIKTFLKTGNQGITGRVFSKSACSLTKPGTPLFLFHNVDIYRWRGMRVIECVWMKMKRNGNIPFVFCIFVMSLSALFLCKEVLYTKASTKFWPLNIGNQQAKFEQKPSMCSISIESP